MTARTQRHRFSYAAFDLDGTLLGADGKVSGVTVAGLRRLREQRISLIIVSGRSPYLVQQLGLSPSLLELFEPLMVLRDGDILWNWQTDSIESIRTVPATVVPAVLRRGCTDIVVDTGRGLVATSERAAIRHVHTYRCARSSIAVTGRPPRTPVTKVTIYGDRRDVTIALTGVAGCSVSPAKDDGRCNVVPFGSCKTAGLARLMRSRYAEPTLGRVVAFGDGDNDACLLGSAGAGIAMAISDPSTARAASRQLTGTLASYLNTEFPHGLGETRREGHRCRHQT